MAKQKKTNGRPFPPGVSGNPSGRPAVIKVVRDLARQHTSAAIDALIEIATKGKNESARVSAASAILDRAYGKPEQAIDMTGKQDITIQIVRFVK